MQTIEIYPSRLSGSVTIAPSKSMMQRVCAAALLYHGTTIIHHPGKSNDDVAALEIIQQLGATVIHHEKTIEIKSSRSCYTLFLLYLQVFILEINHYYVYWIIYNFIHLFYYFKFL